MRCWRRRVVLSLRELRPDVAHTQGGVPGRARSDLRDEQSDLTRLVPTDVQLGSVRAVQDGGGIDTREIVEVLRRQGVIASEAPLVELSAGSVLQLTQRVLRAHANTLTHRRNFSPAHGKQSASGRSPARPAPALLHERWQQLRDVRWRPPGLLSMRQSTCCD